MKRINDIKPYAGEVITVSIDGENVSAVIGETVLTTLFAIGKRSISKNDHGVIAGACCGMGICRCCAVRIDGTEKRLACQTVVQDGMIIETRSNCYDNRLYKQI